MLRLKSAAALAVIIVNVACAEKSDTSVSGSSTDASWSPAKLTSVRGVPAAQIETALGTALEAAPPEKISERQWTRTKRIYRLYGGNPLWLATDGLYEDRAFALATAIIQAEQDGMRMDAYPVGALARVLAAMKDTTAPSAQQLAETDVILTSAFVALGQDYLTGQIDPKTVAQSWHIDPQEENVDSAIVRSLRNTALDKAIATMRPQDADYTGLRKELDRMQQIVVKGGWPSVPRGKAAKPGEAMNAARIDALRRRLTAEGIATAPTSAPANQTNRTQPAAVYDRELAAAVAQFQSRHGIVVDSMLGQETFDALNKPAAYRAAQIAANLERLRWLPRSLGSRHVAVNVPAFRLEAFDNNKKVLEMKVIVGEEYEDKATPVFADSMETVVFRPYWNVPPDIATQEIFPKMRADPGYLAANEMELYQEGGVTRVRQKPGDKNSLGDVKFLFPNDFNIYLHDTPQPELFDKDVRAFSHGCIRIEKPAEFAQWVLGWDANRVQQMLTGSPNQSVKVPKKIPVYITYGTAYIRDGLLYFGNDLYDRDDKLVAEFFRGALPKPETVAAVQALRRIAARS